MNGILTTVAGVAFHTDEAQRTDQQHAEHEQQLPVVAQNVQIQHREQDVQKNSQNEGHKLNVNILIGTGVAGGAGNQHDAEQRCRNAKQQQQRVGPPQVIQNQTVLFLFHNRTSVSVLRQRPQFKSLFTVYHHCTVK